VGRKLRPSLDLEQVSGLIGAIYDASIDQRLWSAFLSRFANTFECDQALLLSTTKDGAPQEILLTEGLDLGIMSRWQGSKDHIDLWYQSLARAAPRQAYLYSQLVPSRRLCQSAFYADFLRISDVEYGVGTVVENSSERQTIVAVFSSKRRGDFAREEQQLSTLLALTCRLSSHHRSLEDGGHWVLL